MRTKASAFMHFSQAMEAAHWLSENKPENTLILIKGSRGIALEKILPSLETTP